MFFGNKKSSVGRMTENDANIIGQEIIRLSALIAGTEKGCFKNTPNSIRKQLALEIACFLPTMYIFKITESHLFETVQANEIENAAQLIGKYIVSNSETFFIRVRCDSKFAVQEDVIDDILECPSHTFRDSTICYINKRIDLMQIDELKFNIFLKSTKTYAPKLSIYSYAFAIFKYRILNLYKFQEFSKEWIDLCEWLDVFNVEISNISKGVIKNLSCK